MVTMNCDATLDWCQGCADDPRRERNLPETWREGDDIPEGVTRHRTPRDSGRTFLFRGPAVRQGRVYL